MALAAPILPQEVNGQISFQRIQDDGGLIYLIPYYLTPAVGDNIYVFFNGNEVDHFFISNSGITFPIQSIIQTGLVQQGINTLYYIVSDSVQNTTSSPPTSIIIDTTPGFLTAEVITDRVPANGDMPIHLRYYLESWQGFPIGLALLEFTISGTAVPIPPSGITNSRGEFDLRLTNLHPGLVTVQCFLASNRNVRNNTDVTFTL